MAKGLLRKTFPSESKALKSLKKAERFLKIARLNFESDAYDGSVIMAYLSVFNAARSVLIKDGFRERSHACVSKYIEKYYVPKHLDKKHIMLFDRYRNLRHADQYDVGFIATAEDAKNMMNFASEFIGKIRKIVASS